MTDAPLLSFTDGTLQTAWDSTSLSAWVRCPRYYQLSILESWEPAGKSPHLWFGGIYASALERFHKLRAQGMEEMEATIAVLHEAMIASWDHDLDAEGNRIPETGAAHDTLHSTKTRDTLLRSIVWYLDHFSSDPMETIILASGEAAAELSFSFDLSSEITYCGHMDRVVSYSGQTWVQDQKTTGTTVTSRYFDSFSPDIQMSGYSLAGQIIFNTPISGVIIDAAQIAVGFTAFSRGFVQRSPAQLEEWRDMALLHIADAQRAHATGTYPMRQTSCDMYGGCPFRRVCSRHPEHRPAILAADFSRRPRWDPLLRR